MAAPAMQNKHAQATKDEGMLADVIPKQVEKRAHVFRGTPPNLSWLLLSMIVLAVALACSDDADTGEPPDKPPVQVQARYREARGFGGHALHVELKRIPCEACHELDGSSFDRPGPKRCATCHPAQAEIRHAVSLDAHAVGDGNSACTSCHVFVPEAGEPAPSAWDCVRCHSAPHASGMTQLEVHATVECRNCHAPHAEPNVRASGCTDCHVDVEASHGRAKLTSPGGGNAAECVVCHDRMHEKTVASAKCEECHGNITPQSAQAATALEFGFVVPKVSAAAVFQAGHERCVDCHKPHAFGKTDAVPCRSCHQDMPTLGSGPAHRNCKNCHAAHDVRSANVAGCTNCHSNLANDHPRVGGSTECGSCHAAHPKGVFAGHRDGTRSCSSCHEGASSESAFHGGTVQCVTCHAPHDFRISLFDTATCNACHASQLAQVSTAPGHARCESCHTGLPHALGQPRTCNECHSSQALSVHPGHADCRSCHETHSGTTTTACADCHRQQHASAPLGHQRCQSCHETHTAKPVSGASCENCHREKVSALHGKLEQGCETCHRAHGPSGVARPPGCASCHSPASLPALHAVAQHQTCGQCHSGHQRRLSGEKALCLSCHQDRVNHFPDAQGCTSCHAFGRW